MGAVTKKVYCPEKMKNIKYIQGKKYNKYFHRL